MQPPLPPFFENIRSTSIAATSFMCQHVVNQDSAWAAIARESVVVVVLVVVLVVVVVSYMFTCRNM